MRTWGTRGSMGERISMTTVVLFKPAHSMILWFYDMRDRMWHWGHEGSGQDRRGRGGHEGTWEIGGGLGDRKGHRGHKEALGTRGNMRSGGNTGNWRGYEGWEETQGYGWPNTSGHKRTAKSTEGQQDTRGHNGDRACGRSLRVPPCWAAPCGAGSQSSGRVQPRSCTRRSGCAHL